MKVLLLTRYDRLGASSRVRALQYLPYFASLGWQVDVAPFFSDAYLDQLYTGKPRWVETLLAYWRRMWAVSKAGRYDLLWIEKELFPFLPAGAERLLKGLGIPYMADYDDALFHRYDKHSSVLVRALLGQKINAVMRHSSMVVAGSVYLAQRAWLSGARRVEIVPTVVDLERYGGCGQNQNKEDSFIVGWIGTPKTGHYLYPLKNVFESLLGEFDVRFVAVGAGRESLGNLPVELWPWSEDTEVASIRRFDIGIMPLEDSAWERGKCGYKLIQYMACGLPVVASKVGVNSEIIKNGVNGFLAGSTEEWLSSLTLLRDDPDLRKKMGTEGRKIVEKKYCLQVTAPKLTSIIRSVKGNDN